MVPLENDDVAASSASVPSSGWLIREIPRGASAPIASMPRRPNGRDPAAVRLPRQRKREASINIPTPEQARQLLDVADERFVAFVTVCAFAGFRLGEAAALQFGDVDFLRRQLHVSQ
jgi:integrase